VLIWANKSTRKAYSSVFLYTTDCPSSDERRTNGSKERGWLGGIAVVALRFSREFTLQPGNDLLHPSMSSMIMKPDKEAVTKRYTSVEVSAHPTCGKGKAFPIAFPFHG